MMQVLPTEVYLHLRIPVAEVGTPMQSLASATTVMLVEILV